MLTEKDYCDLKTVKDLESLGMIVINHSLDGMFLKHVSLYEAQKWLREEKNIIVLVGFDFCPITSEIVYNWVIVVNGNTAKKSSYTYDSFEENLFEGIKEAVKIMKESKGKKG